MWEEQLDKVSHYNKVDIWEKKIMKIKIYLQISNLTWKKYSNKDFIDFSLKKSKLRKNNPNNLKISRKTMMSEYNIDNQWKMNWGIKSDIYKKKNFSIIIRHIHMFH